jgi:hypothetical protein
MRRGTNIWILATSTATAGCYAGAEDGPRRATADRAANVGSCQELGYAGTCIADIGIWWENAACRVRDCASEGKTCGLISNAVGYGCLEGTQGSTAFSCDDVGYEGACLSDDVLVWAENSSCRWADCAQMGLGCGWTDSVGYDCIEGGGDGGGDDGGAPSNDGLLTVGEIVGGVPYGVSQDYGPTNFDGGYSYCQAYGNWGGQLVHCGVDISIPHGTPMYVPADGKVLISGESPYYEDIYNLAAGELKIQLDHDGAHVILGHMTQIDLWTGQVVSAGQWAGLSGSQNGAHVHIEVRLPDANLGLRTVDPMVYFGW